MNNEQLIKNNSKYQNLGHNATPSGRAGYNDIIRQYRRFSEISHFMKDSSGTVLDVGCGNAEFFQYLKQNGFEGEYHGVDVYKELIQEAANRFPDGVFEGAEFLSMGNLKYDYVVASGIFNYDYGQDGVLIKKYLSKMYSMCKRKAIFNGISTQRTRRDEGVFYLDPWEICKWIEIELGCMVEVRCGFLECNFTISMSKASS